MHPIHDDTQLAEAVCGAAVVHRFCTVVTVGAGPQVLGPGYDGVAHHRYESPPGQRLTKAEVVKMVQEWGRDNLTEEGYALNVGPITSMCLEGSTSSENPFRHLFIKPKAPPHTIIGKACEGPSEKREPWEDTHIEQGVRLPCHEHHPAKAWQLRDESAALVAAARRRVKRYRYLATEQHRLLPRQAFLETQADRLEAQIKVVAAALEAEAARREAAMTILVKEEARLREATAALTAAREVLDKREATARARRKRLAVRREKLAEAQARLAEADAGSEEALKLAGQAEEETKKLADFEAWLEKEEAEINEAAKNKGNNYRDRTRHERAKSAEVNARHEAQSSIRQQCEPLAALLEKEKRDKKESQRQRLQALDAGNLVVVELERRQRRAPADGGHARQSAGRQLQRLYRGEVKLPRRFDD